VAFEGRAVLLLDGAAECSGLVQFNAFAAGTRERAPQPPNRDDKKIQEFLPRPIP
jgi:hypothetical protein